MDRTKEIAMRKELRRLREENEKLRTTLIDYYRAEEAYELMQSPQYYGSYREASATLVKLAKELACKETKTRRKAV